MKGERIYRAIGEIDDALLDRCKYALLKGKTGTEKNCLQANKKKQVPVWCKFGAVAASVCLLALSVYVSSHRITENQIIENYTGRYNANSMYAAPNNDTVLLFEDVKSALKEYEGEKRIYFLALDIYKDGMLLELKGNEEQEEVERLINAGYQIGYANTWTYQGDMEKVDVPYLAGYFTEEQLKDFSINDKYGYALRFAENADGSPVSSDQVIESSIKGYGAAQATP